MRKKQSTESTPTTGTNQNSPQSMTGPDLSAEATQAPAQKSKRVRTGCLTCRERHLKCDEGLPNCQNCKRSNRTCRRGVRLNFYDTQCEQPLILLPQTHDWKITFQDDSRDIASEYAGGFERYHSLDPEPKRRKPTQGVGYSQVGGTMLVHQQLPGLSVQTYSEAPPAVYSASSDGYDVAMQKMQSYADQSRQTYPQPVMHQQTEYSPPLDDRTEVLYMQVFVEEVGLWMDSMDTDKHFSRLVPFQALREPMLKFALLACGVRHLTLVNPALYPDNHALNYYNSATQLLLRSLQDSNRDSVLCATTATILNVYEVISEKGLQRMNHTVDARALIKECQWDANATGIGGACFWLNVSLELFSCLHFNWGVACDPDTWGIDMTMKPQLRGGNEEDWTHKILWILAQVVNFRSTAPRFQEQTVQVEQMCMNYCYQEWLGLKQFCDKWDQCVPPTMHAMANVPVCLTASKSTFPEVWFIKRTTIVARLFYHTAMALLGAVHPMSSVDQTVFAKTDEMRQYHSRQICGIVAHVKDRSVASASILCLAVAGENLNVKREQEEVLEIFGKIEKESGWRVAFIGIALKEKWGWTATEYDTSGTSHKATDKRADQASFADTRSSFVRVDLDLSLENMARLTGDMGRLKPTSQMSAACTVANAMHSRANLF